MDAATMGLALDAAFSDPLEWSDRSPKRLYVNVPKERLLEVVGWLRARHPQCRLGTSTGIDLREGVGVFHHFVINGEALVVTLKVLATRPEPTLPSLAASLPAASWIEREIHEFLGVDFEGHPDLRRLLKAEAFPDTFPLRRDFDPAAFKESIGERPEF